MAGPWGDIPSENTQGEPTVTPKRKIVVAPNFWWIVFLNVAYLAFLLITVIPFSLPLVLPLKLLVWTLAGATGLRALTEVVLGMLLRFHTGFRNFVMGA